MPGVQDTQSGQFHSKQVAGHSLWLEILLKSANKTWSKQNGLSLLLTVGHLNFNNVQLQTLMKTNNSMKTTFVPRKERKKGRNAVSSNSQICPMHIKAKSSDSKPVMASIDQNGDKSTEPEVVDTCRPWPGRSHGDQRHLTDRVSWSRAGPRWARRKMIFSKKNKDLLALPQHQHTSFLCPDVSDRIALSFFKELLKKGQGNPVRNVGTKKTRVLVLRES